MASFSDTEYSSDRVGNRWWRAMQGATESRGGWTQVLVVETERVEESGRCIWVEEQTLFGYWSGEGCLVGLLLY